MRHERARRTAIIACCSAIHAYAAPTPAEGTTSLNTTAGAAFAGENARIVLFEARHDTTPHFSMAAALGYLDAGDGYEEAQLRLIGTGAVAVHGWTLENRNMLSLSTESVERYRMRLRATRTGLFGRRFLSARIFDELFFDFDRDAFVRNNIAVGMGISGDGSVTAELYHLWENNRGGADDNYVLALVTVRFGLER